MEQKTFWNDAARYGAVIGLLLALSTLFETWAILSGRTALMGLMIPEFIVAAVLHYVLLHRYTKRYGASFPDVEGFPFSKAYGYILLLSAFAGVVVGAVQAVYLHAVIGYASYVEQYIAAIQNYLSQSGNVTASMEPMLAQLFETLENAEAPSFLQTVWSSFFSSLLFGAFFGLIIAGVLSRAPKLFDKAPEDGEF